MTDQEAGGNSRIDWPSFSAGAAVGGGTVYLLVSAVSLLARVFA